MTEKYQLKSEDIASGSPGYITPIEVHSSPNGDLVTYLFPDHTGKRQLYSINLSEFDWDKSINETVKILFDTANIKEELSLEEQLRRERMRLFVQGISSYEWCHTSEVQTMLVPLSGGVNVLKIPDVPSIEFINAYSGDSGAAIDPHLSPNSEKVAFILSNDIYISSVKSDGEKPSRLTFEADKDGFSAGVADFVAQEEMNRYRGFWWSPDSKFIAFTRNDESKIPQYQILHQGKEDPKHTEHHRYPFAGKRNPIVRLGVISLDKYSPAASPEDYSTLYDIADTSDTRFQTLQEDTGVVETEYYVCRADWWPDGSIMAQIENRNQDLLQLLRINPITGERQVLLEETSPVWINIHDLWKPLSSTYRYPHHPFHEGDFYFIWGSERTGFMQLYLYQYDSVTKKLINLFENAQNSSIGVGGDWVVESIDAIDEEHHLIYFSGNYSDARERHLLQASFHPEDSFTSFHKLTTLSGWHTCEVNVKHSFILDSVSNVETCTAFYIHSFNRENGKITQSKNIYNAALLDSRLTSRPQLLSCLKPPVFHTIRSEDDKVDLHCALYLPDGVTLSDYLHHSHSSTNKPANFPAIVSVYGGPHVQRVANQWLLTSDLRAQKFAQNGIVVIKCDNRGSYRRGISFEGAIKHDMGNIEVQDQVAAVNYFTNIGLVHRGKVGMFGWSYGGYMSAISLCRAPDSFACAVAGAPVTSWDGYDTHYTERYMGRPQENVVGYDASSVMTHVKKMKGKLLLIHGLIDENVHFRHTARLINSLIRERKRYELILFPCERHSPHKLQDRIYLEDIMWEFFINNL